VIAALSLAGLLIIREALNPRYCPTGAIGYLRMVKDGVIVAGGNAKYDIVGPHGYFLTAWFPDKKARLRLFISKGDDITERGEEGRGSIRMHRGTLCAFPPTNI
jgi:hypothetical protein